MFEIIKTVLRHPTFLLLVLPPFNRPDRRINELIYYLIDNTDRIKEIQRAEYETIVEIDGVAYALWRANRFYAYLSQGKRYVKDENGNWRFDCTLWSESRPSLAAAVQFYLVFDSRDPRDDNEELKTFIKESAE